jgi:hypothetical protein
MSREDARSGHGLDGIGTRQTESTRTQRPFGQRLHQRSAGTRKTSPHLRDVRFAAYDGWMRALRTLVAMTIVGAAAMSCAAISGLDQLEKVDCLDDCEGGAESGGDVTVPSADGGNDVNAPDGDDDGADGTTDSAMDAPEASADTGIDAADAGDADAARDSGTADTGPDAQDGAADADAGCGATNTILNCGACGNVCDTIHSLGATCNGTTCVYAGCAAGYGDCDLTAPNTNGCETRTNTITHCGACGNVCDTVTSAGASCNGLSCQYSGCAAGFANCNQAPPDTNGCETATTTTANCGGCGSVCDSASSNNASCNGTTCIYASCQSGRLDCDTTPPNTNGCESSSTSTNTCVACGNVCDTAKSNGATCNGTSCLYSSCKSGFADCITTGPPNTDGCETPINTVTNCSGCGITCDSATNSTRTCNGTSCGYTCNAGRADCNLATAPNVDGCECGTPGCCGTGCQTTHSNGVGQSFYDCVTVGTYDQTQAQEACVAFTGNAAQCSVFTCGGNSNTSMCSDTSPTRCDCWGFGGTQKGKVHAGPGAGASNCFCIVAADPIWN